MRIDHHAYQRGTQVAGFGLLLQLVIGLTLLIVSKFFKDDALLFASCFALLGVLVWLGLVVIFHQHKLERLEALEEDELAAARAGASSIFDAMSDEHRVAARRLAMMYKWLMPTVSLLLAGLLLLAAWLIRTLKFGETANPLEMSQLVGWTVALCLSIALITFIFSRFVAGMAKLPAWQNLRGGAGYMVGTSLVMIAVATGTVFRVFDNHAVLHFIAQWVIPAIMTILAVEIILNFILNIYRPRIAGETPRPAFDSRMLSLLAAPDSIVRSLNEAINYQFGFDITSSWGYQLLLRSFVWLLALGAAVLILLNTMVIVEPHQEAVKLSWGRIVSGPHGSGILWKLPWPFQSAEVYDVTTLREMSLTARRREDFRRRDLHLWTDEIQWIGELEPFLVSSSALLMDHEIVDQDDDLFQASDTEPDYTEDAPLPGVGDAESGVEELVTAAEHFTPDQARTTAATSRAYALLDAEITLQYRIKNDASGSGLIDYLTFVPDVVTRRQRMSEREEALRLLALRSVTQYLSTLTIDDVLTSNRYHLASQLRDQIQRSFDERKTGIQVVAVNLPLLRPSGTTAQKFEELAVGNQARQQQIAIARRQVMMTLAYLAGDVPTAMHLIEEIDKFNQQRDRLGAHHPDVIELGAFIEREIVRSGGAAAQMITSAERDRWVQLMEARSQASRMRGQQRAFRASPELYKQREIMRVIAEKYAPLRKYVIGIDPSRINLDVDLKELSPLLDFSQTLGEE